MASALCEHLAACFTRGPFIADAESRIQYAVGLGAAFGHLQCQHNACVRSHIGSVSIIKTRIVNYDSKQKKFPKRDEIKLCELALYNALSKT